MAELIYRFEYIKLNGILRESMADNAVLFFGLAALFILLSYFIGGLNFAIIFSKLFYHDDIRHYGSGNAGFTNMKRTFGTKAGVLVMVCDVGKNFLCTFFTMLLFGSDMATLAGLACILGHCFPCLYHFKGGKGVAATAAMVFVLDPLLAVILIAIFLLVVYGTKYLSMGSIMAIILYPILHNTLYNYLHNEVLPNYFIRNGLYTEIVTLNGAVTDVTDFVQTLKHTASPIAVITAVFLAVFIVFMHRTNIRRIMNGEENRFYFSKKQRDAEAAAAKGLASSSSRQKSLDDYDEELKG